MEQLTQNEKARMGTKEITKRIRQQLKNDLKGCVFSVNFQSFAGGSSISIYLMSSNIRIVKPFEALTQKALHNYGEAQHRKLDELKAMQEGTSHQLSQYIGDYDADTWNNGVFLTEAGHNLLKKVVEISDQYNYDNSEPETDYFDNNFYLHLKSWQVGQTLQRREWLKLNEVKRMKKFEVNFEVSSFNYEVEAENEKEAEQQALTTMFEDIHHNTNQIITNTKITEIKPLKGLDKKAEIISAMKRLGVDAIVNNGATAKQISKEAGIPQTTTRLLLGELGEEGIVDYMKEYHYWIFQK